MVLMKVVASSVSRQSWGVRFFGGVEVFGVRSRCSMRQPVPPSGLGGSAWRVCGRPATPPPIGCRALSRRHAGAASAPHLGGCVGVGDGGQEGRHQRRHLRRPDDAPHLAQGLARGALDLRAWSDGRAGPGRAGPGVEAWGLCAEWLVDAFVAALCTRHASIAVASASCFLCQAPTKEEPMEAGRKPKPTLTLGWGSDSTPPSRGTMVGRQLPSCFGAQCAIAPSSCVDPCLVRHAGSSRPFSSAGSTSFTPAVGSGEGGAVSSVATLRHRPACEPRARVSRKSRHCAVHHRRRPLDPATTPPRVGQAPPQRPRTGRC
jgi:hypothetical protein